MPVTAEERSRNARRAALVRSSQYDGRTVTAAARQTWLASFAPDDPELDADERERRGRAALRARMIELSQRATAARRASARAVQLADEALTIADDIARAAL